MDKNAFEHLNAEELIAILGRLVILLGIFGLALGEGIRLPNVTQTIVILFLVWIVLSTFTLLLTREHIQLYSLSIHLVDTAMFFYIVLESGGSNSYFAYILPLLVIPAGLFVGMIYLVLAAPGIFIGYSFILAQKHSMFSLLVAFWVMYYLVSLVFTLLLLNMRQNRKYYIMYREMERNSKSGEKRISELEENLAKHKIEDDTTGLTNFRFFRKQLEDEVKRAKRYKTRFSLCFLSIENMKEIELTFPPEKRKAAIAEIAKSMRDALRDTDQICRHTEDQFLFLWVGSDAKQSIIPARRIAEQMSNVKMVSGFSFSLQLCFGIASYPEDSEDVVGLISLASSALVRSRQRGSGKITLASSLYRKLP